MSAAGSKLQLSRSAAMEFLTNRTLRVAYIVSLACVNRVPVTNDLPREECFFAPKSYHLLRLISDYENIRFQCYPTPNGGVRIGNTTSWTGVTGLLLNGTVDITAPDLILNEERSRVVAFAEVISFFPSFLFMVCLPLDK